MDLSLELTKIMTFEILINQNTFPARVICAVLLGSCYLALGLLRSRTYIFKRIFRNENKQCIRIFKNVHDVLNNICHQVSFHYSY